MYVKAIILHDCVLTFNRKGNSVVSKTRYPPLRKRYETSTSDIVRILFMVPIYALISFASYLFWVRVIFR